MIKETISTRKAITLLTVALISGYFLYPFTYSVLKALNVISYGHHGANMMVIFACLMSLFSVCLSWIVLEEWLKKYSFWKRLAILSAYMLCYLGFPVIMTLFGRIPI